MRVNENELLSISDARAIKNHAEETIDKALDLTYRLVTRLGILYKDLRVEKETLNACEQDEVYSNIREIAYDIHSALRDTANRFQLLTAAPAYFSALPDPPKEMNHYYKEVILPSDQVSAALENDAIYVRTPMLWSRNNRKIHSESGCAVSPEKFTMYRDSVTYAILNAPGYNGYDFKRYEHKTIQYLFVYNDSAKNHINLIDNDNHEAKWVTDAISAFLPGGDNPLFCDFYLTGTLSAAIPEGTYITVTGASSGMKTKQEVIEFWINHMAPGSDPTN